ncbi:helix-turn-helix domain-containing protein [Rhodothermus marinus]|uniref:DNA binding domain protein, excisionase family n=1 Tax=Rhodothermus marinus (strain ATCC 43812 / DSM 4252 / R-10) TaxID=518766 RepID=D0MK57_RHOM4|nr:helix-turn-helix domain-containing protein [Rhodothermus marinus]ACY46970.1 DNA binding domain protein, excisionase family [Rhodothermus marinus DSM 4252]
MLKAEKEQRLDPLLLTPREVCALLRIGRTTLWELRRRGLLRAVYVGRSPRFRREDVEQLVERLAVKSPIE